MPQFHPLREMRKERRPLFFARASRYTFQDSGKNRFGMLLSIEKRFLFVANTKTASTSIEVALKPFAEIVRAGTPERKHTTLYRVLQDYDFMFQRPEHSPERFFKFGVMRDPIDWINSWFRYRKGNEVAAPLPADMSFADFWRRKDWNIERPNGAGKNLQRDMFCAPDGTVLADVVIQHHRLAPTFATICDALDIRSPLERHNVSEITPRDDIPADLKAEMEEFYADDYALFDQLEDLNAPGLERLRARINETA